MLKRIFWIILSVPTVLFGQTSFTPLPSYGQVLVGDIAVAEGGDWQVVAGEFTVHISLPNQPTINSLGREDGYLYCTQGGGWTKYLQSSREAAWTQVAIAQDGSIFSLGHFRELARIDNLILQGGSARTYVLAHWSAEGELLNHQQIEGPHFKELMALSVHQNGQIGLAGHFQGILHIGESYIQTNLPQAGLLTVWSSDLELLNLKILSGTSVEIRDIEAWGMDSWAACGTFQTFLIHGEDTLRTETADRDGFLTTWIMPRDSITLLRLGGVHDDDPVALATNSGGMLFIGGYFVGTMFMPDGSTLMSTNGFANAFLLQFSSQRAYLSGKTWGGPLTQELTDLTTDDHQRVYTIGNSLGSFSIGGYDFDSRHGVQGWMLEHDATDLTTQKMVPLQATGQAFPTTIARADSLVSVGGSFSGKWKESTAEAPLDSYWGFIYQEIERPTLDHTGIYEKKVLLYPNPAHNILQIQNPEAPFTVTVYEVTGKRVFSGENTLQINLSDWPSGSYWLILQNRKATYSSHFIKK